RAAGLVALLVVAVIAIGVAVWSSITSLQNATEASNQKSTAEAASQRAQQNEQIAQNQKATAEAASREAQAQTRLSRIREIAAQAQAAAKQSPQTSLLLAAESLLASRDAGEAPLDAARTAAYDTIAQVEGHALDGGLTANVDSVILST